MFLPPITIQTATNIMTRPTVSLNDNDSPKNRIPKTTAVTGSNAPNMAVGVAPTYWTAIVVQTNDSTVGNITIQMI